MGPHLYIYLQERPRGRRHELWYVGTVSCLNAALFTLLSLNLCNASAGLLSVDPFQGESLLHNVLQAIATTVVDFGPGAFDLPLHQGFDAYRVLLRFQNEDKVSLILRHPEPRSRGLHLLKEGCILLMLRVASKLGLEVSDLQVCMPAAREFYLIP